MDDPSGDHVGEPVARLGRRRRRDDLDGARSRLRKYEGMTLTADRQGDGKGSARRGDGSRHRRSRRDVRHHIDHGRRRRADGARRIRWSAWAPTPARRRRTASSRNRNRTRAHGDRSRGFSGHYVRDEHLLALEEADPQDDIEGRRRASHLNRPRACCARD